MYTVTLHINPCKVSFFSHLHDICVSLHQDILASSLMREALFNMPMSLCHTQPQPQTNRLYTKLNCRWRAFIVLIIIIGDKVSLVQESYLSLWTQPGSFYSSSKSHSSPCEYVRSLIRCLSKDIFSRKHIVILIMGMTNCHTNEKKLSSLQACVIALHKERC